MEKQIEKFSSLCAVFDILVFDENTEYVSLVKDKYELGVSKECLSNDYHLIKSLLMAYSTFNEAERNGSYETIW